LPSAAPTANTVAWSKGGSPATPRIPSVPNNILIGQKFLSRETIMKCVVRVFDPRKEILA
jgi:hypothetical protein